MALLNIENFKLITKEKNNIHQKTDAKYTYFDIQGKRYFQIDTFGTAERKNPHKCSQSVQLDKEMAKDLILILQKVFKI